MTTSPASHVEPRRRPIPGDALLQPVALGAIALLLLNDHVFKAIAPGLVTGKLSDVAGLVFFPMLLVAVAELVLAATGRWHGPDARLVTVAVAATGIAFTAVKLLPGAEALYEGVLGLAQWPFRLLAGLFPGSAAAGGPVAVDLTRDATDLVALVALWIPMELGVRRARPARPRSRSPCVRRAPPTVRPRRGRPVRGDAGRSDHGRLGAQPPAARARVRHHAVASRRVRSVPRRRHRPARTAGDSEARRPVGGCGDPGGLRDLGRGRGVLPRDGCRRHRLARPVRDRGGRRGPAQPDAPRSGRGRVPDRERADPRGVDPRRSGRRGRHSCRRSCRRSRSRGSSRSRSTSRIRSSTRGRDSATSSTTRRGTGRTSASRRPS